METIRRYDVLREMDITTTPEGRVRLFSIAFVTKTGEYIYLPFARKGGIRADMKRVRCRGVIPCSSTGQPIGHVYPVSIDNILQYNGKQVIL